MSISDETAKDIIIEALEDISVHMDETTLGASDERAGIKGINRIMATLEANGVDLGFTKLTKGNDIVTIPDGAIDSLISLLGFRLWPKYRTPEPPILIVTNARQGMKQMYRLGISISSSSYPCNLPRGSGNVEPGEDVFYPCVIEATTSIPSDSIWNNALNDIWDETLDSNWEVV